MQLAVFLFHLEVLLLPFIINQKEIRKRYKTDLTGVKAGARYWRAETVNQKLASVNTSCLLKKRG
jgi:hypothetical protein